MGAEQRHAAEPCVVVMVRNFASRHAAVQSPYAAEDSTVDVAPDDGDGAAVNANGATADVHNNHRIDLDTNIFDGTESTVVYGTSRRAAVVYYDGMVFIISTNVIAAAG